MSNVSKIELLNQLQSILKEIVEETKRQVNVYDALTHQVDNGVKLYLKTGEIPKMNDWTNSQRKLFRIYKKLFTIK